MNAPLRLSHIEDHNVYDGTWYGLVLLVPVSVLFAVALALAIHA